MATLAESCLPRVAGRHVRTDVPRGGLALLALMRSPGWRLDSTSRETRSRYALSCPTPTLFESVRELHRCGLGEWFLELPNQLNGGITNLLFIACLVFGEPFTVVVSLQVTEELEQLGGNDWFWHRWQEDHLEKYDELGPSDCCADECA